jgi:hypothetical protein
LGVMLTKGFFSFLFKKKCFCCFCCQMALSLRPPLVQDTPCLHCSGLYILSSLLGHVKSVHPLTRLVPHVVGLFFLCRRPPFMCFSLILFLLLLGVGFRHNLTPFWGCLSFISHVFVCFIRSFKPSKMKSCRLVVYPLTELPKT